MEKHNKKEEQGWLITNLMSDLLLTILLPLVIVISLFSILKARDSEMLHIPTDPFEAAIYVALPELAFATLFIWTLVRKRLTECRVPMRIRLDSVVLSFVVFSSICLSAVLLFSWTTNSVNYVVLGFQVFLLVIGIAFNIMITIRDYYYLEEAIDETDSIPCEKPIE